MRKLFWTALAGLALLGLVMLIGPLFIATDSVRQTGKAEDFATSDSQFTTIDFPGTEGLRIHYLQAESAPRVKSCEQNFILLHGFTLNAWSWRDVMPLFAEYGRVVAYDQVPYGLSSKLPRGQWQGPSPYTQEAAVEQLWALMAAWGMEQATLVGNSAGGTLALNAVLDRPSRVQSLLLVDPWIIIKRPTFPEFLVETPHMRRVSLALARFLGNEAKLLQWSYSQPQRISAKRLQLARKHTRVANWDLAWGALFNQSLASSIDIFGRLANIRQSTLVVQGQDDRLVPVADTRRAFERLPDAELNILAGCGHLPQEECDDAFIQAVRPWLEQQRQSQCAPGGSFGFKNLGNNQ